MQLYLLKEHVLAFDASLKFVFSDEMFFAKLGEKVLLHCQDFGQESFISSGYSASWLTGKHVFFVYWVSIHEDTDVLSS